MAMLPLMTSTEMRALPGSLRFFETYKALQNAHKTFNFLLQILVVLYVACAQSIIFLIDSGARGLFLFPSRLTDQQNPLRLSLFAPSFHLELFSHNSVTQRNLLHNHRQQLDMQAYYSFLERSRLPLCEVILLN